MKIDIEFLLKNFILASLFLALGVFATVTRDPTIRPPCFFMMLILLIMCVWSFYQEPMFKRLIHKSRVGKGECLCLEIPDLSGADCLYIAIRNIDNRLDFKVILVHRKDISIEISDGANLVEAEELSFVKRGAGGYNGGGGYSGFIDWKSSKAIIYTSNGHDLRLKVESLNCDVRVQVYGGKYAFSGSGSL